MHWQDAAHQGSLAAAGLNVVLLALLLLTRRWWSARAAAPTAAAWPAPLPAPPPGAAARWFMPALAAILLLAGVLRYDLARSSLWWDEVWQARHASVGEWRQEKKTGTLKFRETTFAQALWNYRKPTNHPPMAVASKVCHEVWRRATRAAPGAFDELVLRLPACAASLAGLALVALLLRAWGLPAAGLAAAAFLALHPWHIRYGIDGRGYTFLIPLTAVGLWSLWRACAPATRGPAPPSAAWLFGLTQALILWSHLLSVWVCLALCATGCWWIWHHHRGPERWHRLARLAAAQVAGAMLLLQLFLPNLLQAVQWGEKNQDGQLMDARLLVASLHQMAAGHAQPLASALALALAATGLAWAWKNRHPAAAALSHLFLAAAGFLAAVEISDFHFYPRFAFAVMVPLAAAVGLAIHALGRPVKTPATATRAWPGLALAAVGLSLAHGLPAVRPPGGFSPLRETATVLRQAQTTGAHIFGYGFGAEALQYYLPSLPYSRETNAPEALAKAAATARAAGQPLYVAVGYQPLNRLHLPDGFQQLDNPAEWTEIWNQSGIESQFSYTIWKSTTPPATASGK